MTYKMGKTKVTSIYLDRETKILGTENAKAFGLSLSAYLRLLIHQNSNTTKNIEITAKDGTAIYGLLGEGDV